MVRFRKTTAWRSSSARIPTRSGTTYGFEINAIGTMLNFIRADWRQGPFNWEPEGVRYRTSLHGLPKKTESPDDNHWILELAIPWSNFVRDAAPTPPRDGDVWRLNLNRAGGITGAQYSTWSPVSTPKPNFHVPESFGWVRFVDREPPLRWPRGGDKGRVPALGSKSATP
jgi:hypothetical protein